MKSLNGNAVWLRERAAGIRRGDKPKTKAEWLAFATGMEMIAADWEKTQDLILAAIADGSPQ